MNLYKTQIKRELWENKVSFLYTPIAVTLLILGFVVCAAFYTKGVINGQGVHFNLTSNGMPLEAGVTVDRGAGIYPVDSENLSNQKVNLVSAIKADSSVFNGFVSGVMYANCVMLYLVFSIVLSAYALRCLFDDRKNKDILFWRSMPVSETTNVITKLMMIYLIGPLVILILNILVVILVLAIAITYFASHGIGVGQLLMSVIDGGLYYIPLQIFYELIFSLLMLAPIIGLALFSSAYARKTPFYIFAVPFLLIGADKILNSVLGYSLGLAKLLKAYGYSIALTQDAFLLKHPLHFTPSMIMPLLICIAVGAAFTLGAIWLRNNRYEI